jgi:hypothetical protein
MAWFLCETLERLQQTWGFNLNLGGGLLHFGFAAGKFLFDDLPDVVGRELTLERFVQHIDDSLADEFAPLGPAECAGPGADGQTRAADRFDYLITLQVPVGAGASSRTLGIICPVSNTPLAIANLICRVICS